VDGKDGEGSFKLETVGRHEVFRFSSFWKAVSGGRVVAVEADLLSAAQIW
jgi:hypothetical protein